MPVMHYVFHAYGTWHPDHPRGWHQHGVGRPLAPAPSIAAYRRAIQRWPAARFTPNVQQHLLVFVLEACRRRNWRPHVVAINETHVHIVPSWLNEKHPKDVQDTLKRLLGWRCAQLHDQPGRRWFSDGGHPEAVHDLEHLRYLKNTYLPDQGGVFWKEGNPDPQPPPD